MTDLQTLAESTPDDPELIPEILPAEARLAIGVKTSDLLALFTRAAAVAPSREMLPGTSMALIEAVPASDGAVAHVSVSASDGQQWISIVHDGQLRIYRPGRALVPAKKILDVLKLAPHKATRLTIVGTKAHVQSGRVRWNIETPVSDRLAVTPQELEVETFSVPVGPLRAALRAVRPAIATSRARGSFMQAHVALGVITATDGPRLHRVTVEGLDESIETDIPGFAVPQLLSLIEDLDDADSIEFGGNDRRILFRAGPHTLIVQRLHERFPEVESVILAPTFANDRYLTVDRVEILKSIKRVRINADPDQSSILLVVEPRANGRGWSLAIVARDRSGNEAQEDLPCQWNSEQGHNVMLNHIHLSEMLSAVGGDTAVLRLGPDTKTNRTPVLIEADGFTGVLAQLRPDWDR